MKDIERKEAEKLRRQGMTYRQIAKRLNVSKGTVSVWLSDLILSDEERLVLAANCRIISSDSGNGNRIKWEKLKQEVKSAYKPPLNDPNFTLGLALYWGEGNKTGTVGLVNTDPLLLKKFIIWIKDFFKEDYEDFVLTIHHYKPNEDNLIKHWWRQELGIEQFCKSNFSISCQSKLKRNTLPYGTARVVVRGKNTWRIKTKINKAMELINQFERIDYIVG